MITIYSQTNCPNCVFAAQRLTEMGLVFEEVKIDKDAGAKTFVVSRGFRTVPQIYHAGNDVFIQGGWLGLKEMSEQQVKGLLYGQS